MKSVVQARYALALAKNSMTDEIRNAYLEELNSEDLNMLFFGYLLNIIASILQKGKCTLDEAINTIQLEYNAFKLHETLGDFSKYQQFINVVLQEIKSNSTRLVQCKKLIAAANDIQDIPIKYGTYLSVLSYLVSMNMILNDMEFSENIVKFVDTINIEEDTGFNEFRTFVGFAFAPPVINTNE